MVRDRRGWRCLLCASTSRLRKGLVFARCPGSVVHRWAQAAEALSCTGTVGGGHVRMLTGDIVWCFRCGAYADRHARRLAFTCRGVLAGSMKICWQRLLINTHPLTRVAIGPGPFAEPGARLPMAFSYCRGLSPRCRGMAQPPCWAHERGQSGDAWHGAAGCPGASPGCCGGSAGWCTCPFCCQEEGFDGS